MIQDKFGTRQQEFVGMLSKLFLGGKYNLVEFDDKWKTSIQQYWQETTLSPYADICRIQPDLSLELFRSGNYTYPLKENENLQFYAPNLVDIQTYSNYVKYEYINLVNPSNVLPKDADVTLGPGETLTLFWKTTEDSNYQYYKYIQGDIIRASFAVYVSRTSISSDLTAGAGIVLDPEANAAIEEFKTTLSSNRQIVNRKLNIVSLDKTFNYVYWIRNYTTLDNAGNKLYELFEDESGWDYETGTAHYILHSGEYLLYTNEAFTSLNIVGAGTEITYKFENYNDSQQFYATFPLSVSVIDYSNIISNGISAIAEDNWYVFKNAVATMKLTEMQFVNLGVGCTVTFTYNGSDSAPSSLDLDTVGAPYSMRDWIVSYTIEGDTSIHNLPLISDPSLCWLCIPTLDINLTSSVPQFLAYEDTDTYIKCTGMTVWEGYLNDGTWEEYEMHIQECYVLSDKDLFIGGSSIVSTEFTDEQANLSYLHLYCFSYAQADPEFEFLNDQTVRLKLYPGNYDRGFQIEYKLPYRDNASTGLYSMAGYILKVIQPSTELHNFAIYSDYNGMCHTVFGKDDLSQSGVYFVRVNHNDRLSMRVYGEITRTTYITFECCKFGALKFSGSISSDSGDEKLYTKSATDTSIPDYDAYNKNIIIEEAMKVAGSIVYYSGYDGKFDLMYKESESEAFDPFEPLDYFNPSNPYSAHTIAKLNNVNISAINRG